MEIEIWYAHVYLLKRMSTASNQKKEYEARLVGTFESNLGYRHR